jgi:ABC-type multidrug transport system fused ATPase/permease subunit
VSRRSWFEGQVVVAGFWALLSALLVPVVLVSLILFLELAGNSSSVVATAEEWKAFTGSEQASLQGDLGLWKPAWRLHRGLGWSWLPGLCRAVPGLGKTLPALAAVLLTGAVSSLLLVFFSGQLLLQAALAARDAVRQLRTSVYRQTLRLGPSDLSGKRFETAQRLFTDDTEVIREALTQWRSRWPLVLTRLPVLGISLLAIDWKLALQCLVPAAGCWWVWRYERDRMAHQRQLAESRAESELRFLAEGLKNSRLIRGYNMEEFEQKLFAGHLDRMARESGFGRRSVRISTTLAQLATVVGVGLVLFLVGAKVTAPVGAIPLSFALTLGVAILWLMFELGSLRKISEAQSQLMLSGDRIYRYLDEIPEVGQAVGAKFIEPVTKSVQLEGVSYRKGNEEIQQGVELKIPARSQVALVSLDPLLPKAVASMFPRFIEPTVGRILFDGQDIAWGTLESIRAETAYVGGDDVLLSGSVLDNIICGDTRYSVEDATEAAKAVHAHSFIIKLPQGYETILGEHGEQLDPGQIFRIGLARAVLRNPALMIIEEPAVLLDEDTKALTDDAYQRISAGRTVIYLPSRLTTIRRCDQVVFLHDGKVECVGSHSELRKSSELYRHWDYVTFNAYRRRTSSQD